MAIGLRELLIHVQNHLSFNYTSSTIKNTIENLRRRFIVPKKTRILFKKIGDATQAKQIRVGVTEQIFSHSIKFQLRTFF